MEPNIPLARPWVDSSMIQAATDVITSRRWVKGPESRAFGGEFAHYCGAEAAVPCASGSASLIAALRLLDIGPGDEVIVPSLTFFASVSCIEIVGATPVFVDVEEEYWCLDPKSVADAVTERTKAILGVHLFGQPFSMKLPEGVPIIEDAAQAHGAILNGSMVGSLGDIACFSFFPSKNMAVGGEGGMITTTRLDLAERLQSWVDHGRSKDSSIEALTSNLRMSEIQAAIGRAQLKHLDEWQIRRQEIAALHTQVIDQIPLLKAPKVRAGAIHGWHQYVLYCDHPAELVEHLSNRGIESRVHYSTPSHRQPVMSEHPQHKEGSLPVTERICSNLVSIPVHPFLTDEEISRIHDALHNFSIV
ncbi:MAG: aminotransferase DegT [Euryarchaeota archaeon]|nr:aminotransferase DegT [Euryarchaeota archaeon]